MDKISLQRLRELILDSHSFDETGIGFDADKALELGYSEAEIKIASKILATEPNTGLNNLFKSKIFFCNPHLQAKKCVDVYYVRLAKIIFVIDTDAEVYCHILEEELEEKVSQLQQVIALYEYNGVNPVINDCYGNSI